MTTPEEGLEKTALLLLTLGPDEAAEVLKHLGPREVQRISMKMASMAPQERSKVEPLLEEVTQHFGKGRLIEADEDHLRQMLTKALGVDRANHLLSRMVPGSDTAGIESLKWMDAATAADLIKNEHPQIVAAIMRACQAWVPSSPVTVPGSIACISTVHSRVGKLIGVPSSPFGTSPTATTSSETASTAARAISRCPKIRAQAPRAIRASKA